MRCGMDYCIYNENLLCKLGEIEMNSLGMCDACEIVAIPKEKLGEYKINQLQEIERRN